LGDASGCDSREFDVINDFICGIEEVDMGYFETDEIKGETPFKCYVCGKMMLADVEGEYKLKLKCTRCKTKVTLETEHALPDTLVVKHGELVHL
jgi:phage FluMu protein Com